MKHVIAHARQLAAQLGTELHLHAAAPRHRIVRNLDGDALLAIQLQQGRLHVVDVHRILRHVPAEVVGLAVDVPFPDATARQPPAVGAAEVVATLA